MIKLIILVLIIIDTLFEFVKPPKENPHSYDKIFFFTEISPVTMYILCFIIGIMFMIYARLMFIKKRKQVNQLGL